MPSIGFCIPKSVNFMTSPLALNDANGTKNSKALTIADNNM